MSGMDSAKHDLKPLRHAIRQWKEGHRLVQKLREQEWLDLSPIERLRALGMLYEMARSRGLHERTKPQVCERWLKIKRKWLTENLPSQKGS